MCAQCKLRKEQVLGEVETLPYPKQERQKYQANMDIQGVI